MDPITIFAGILTSVLSSAAIWFVRRSSVFFNEHHKMVEILLKDYEVPQLERQPDGQMTKLMSLPQMVLQSIAENHVVIRWQAHHDHVWPESKDLAEQVRAGD